MNNKKLVKDLLYFRLSEFVFKINSYKNHKLIIIQQILLLRNVLNWVWVRIIELCVCVYKGRLMVVARSPCPPWVCFGT